MLATLSCHYFIFILFVKCGFLSASSEMKKSVCRMDSGDIWHMICRNSIDAISGNNEITKLTVLANRTLTLSNTTFNSFKQLRKLTIKSPAEKWQNLHLEEGLLAPLGNTLEEVTISHTNATNVSKNLFCGLLRLYKVKLTYNAINTIEAIGFGDECKWEFSGKFMYAADFRNNKIKYLYNNGFTHLINLVDLYLSNNNLENVETGAFAGLSNVQILSLRNNNLRELPQNVFENLTALLELDLSSNGLTILPSFQWQIKLNKLKLGINKLTTITENIFVQMPQLTSLDLSDNKLHEFESGFKLVSDTCFLVDGGQSIFGNINCLQNLQHLSLKGNGITNISQIQNQIPRNIENINLSENGIKVVEEQSFATLVNLRIINLSHNRIERIENGAFDHNIGLSRVAIDYNQLTTLSSVFDSTGLLFISAAHNNIKYFVYTVHSPTFEMLDLSHNQIQNFKFLKKDQWSGSKTMEINLSFNKLTSVSDLQFPEHVSTIRLNDNLIRTITPQSLITPLRNLRVLNLHNNNLTTFCQVLYRINMDYVFQNYIAVTLRGNPLTCSCDNEWMKQNTGKYIFIEDIEFVMCKSYFPIGMSNQKIHTNDNFLCQSNTCECFSTTHSVLHQNCLNYECPENCSCYYSRNGSFSYIDCSNKSLTSVPKAWQHSAKVVYLYLDGNQIFYINESYFSNYQSIRKLYLNNNNMLSFHENAFMYGLEGIEVLHLGNNLLENIPGRAFSNLAILRELYLSHNRLRSLPSFDQRNLQVLQLDNNDLVSYPVWQLQNFTNLREITLDGNPWSCECDYVVEFRNWLMLATNVQNPEDVFCTNVTETKQLISERFQVCTDKIINILFSYAPIWASALAVSACLAIGSLLIFLYRREVRLLIYFRYYFLRKNCEMDENKKYDIFLSYSSKDAQFLVENILPGLEEIENPYSTLVHQRDFLAGGYIKDVIVRAIDDSRRTLVLLSENFVQHELCCFGFKMAHAKMLEDKCKRVVLVVKDRIPENINSDMKAYIRTNNYLVWGEPRFWKKLLSALPDKTIKRLADVTEC